MDTLGYQERLNRTYTYHMEHINNCQCVLIHICPVQHRVGREINKLKLVNI